MRFQSSVRRKCPELDDNRFQARAVRFWTQYVERVIVKFCDVNHPIKTKPLSCDSKMRNFTIWTNPSKGKTITVSITAILYNQSAQYLQYHIMVNILLGLYLQRYNSYFNSTGNVSVGHTKIAFLPSRQFNERSSIDLSYFAVLFQCQC